MRDIALMALIVSACIVSLRRPWVGVILWTWVSTMNPHRYTFGFAYDMPVAAMSAVSTFIGFVITSDKRSSPFKTPAVGFFFAFMVWFTISWLLGLDVAGDYEQWNKVMKIDVMVMIGLALLHSKKHVLALAWVSAGALMLLGAKGGLFTIASGGSERVWGPPGSFIEDNNEFGLALIMTIPLLRFLQLQLSNRYGRWAMGAGMLLCAAAAIGTQSRGALLAIVAMGSLFWLRGTNKFRNGILIVVFGIGLAAFMPDKWVDRMNTIETYEQDGSAQGRLAAWSAAWGISFKYPTGVGFNQIRQELFDQYSHNPGAGARAAHSIYFQVLGNHGWVGLILFMGIWIATWRQASWLRKHARGIPEAQWCADLGSMVHASLLGFFVGGAFLSLAYFDLPYNIMMMVSVAVVWLRTRAWEREPAVKPSWFNVPGLTPATR